MEKKNVIMFEHSITCNCEKGHKRNLVYHINTRKQIKGKISEYCTICNKVSDFEIAFYNKNIKEVK